MSRPRHAHRRSIRALAAVPLVVVVVTTATACSGDDDATAGPGTTELPGDPADATDPPTDPPADTSPATAPGAGDEPSGATGDAATLPTDPVVVPETGVPGLDSDDEFCAAWSRFGGTWQVLLVASTFLDDPDRVATWEVAASQMLIDAWSTLDLEFPAELEAEHDDALDGYFGVLERRALDARDALADVGASDADVARLTDLWLAALETRDPLSPDVAFEVPADLVDVVDEAAAEFRAQRRELQLDPSMAVRVETPATDAYLETECPDQGTLAGGEVVDDGSGTSVPVSSAPDSTVDA